MPLTMYGIRNCDTVKKARDWLAAHAIDFAFHDYKTAGIDAGTLAAWCTERGWETVLNRAGTTFRALSDPEKRQLDAPRAMALMLAQPSMIKRPVVEGPGILLIGFTPAHYQSAFAGLGAPT